MQRRQSWLKYVGLAIVLRALLDCCSCPLSIIEVCTSAKWYLGRAHKLNPSLEAPLPILALNLVALAIFMANNERDTRLKEQSAPMGDTSPFIYMPSLMEALIEFYIRILGKTGLLEYLLTFVNPFRYCCGKKPIILYF